MQANTSVTGEYKGREWPEGRNILKQYWADVTLKGGLQIAVRCFGRYNSSLWDDVFAEFAPLTERDLIIVNFGAWCATASRPSPRLWPPLAQSMNLQRGHCADHERNHLHNLSDALLGRAHSLTGQLVATVVWALTQSRVLRRYPRFNLNEPRVSLFPCTHGLERAA